MTLAADELACSPAWLPLDVQGGAVRLVRLDEAAYHEASLLDQRLRITFIESQIPDATQRDLLYALGELRAAEGLKMETLGLWGVTESNRRPAD